MVDSISIACICFLLYLLILLKGEDIIFGSERFVFILFQYRDIERGVSIVERYGVNLLCQINSDADFFVTIE